ncbi:MAG: hypothetical protein ACKVP4_02185 [Hyphomicrobium sp.]
MNRFHIPASVMLALIAATTTAYAASKPADTGGGGRTLSDYNIQKESAAPRLRLRIAPR